MLDDLELIPVNKIGPDILAVEQYETIWCLSRIRGLPQAISFGEVTDDAEMSLRDLRDTLRAGRTVGAGMRQGASPQTASLDATVVICTRTGRPGCARRSLALACGHRLPLTSGFLSWATARVEYRGWL